MSAGRPKLDERMEATIAALLTERTHALAAAKAGISEATITRWLRDESFQNAYRAARRTLVEGAVGRLQQGASKAVDCLERNLTCGQPGHEVRAALGILDQATRGIEFLDMVARVDLLEGLLRGTHDDDPADPGEAGQTDSRGAGEKGGGDPLP